MGCEKTVDFERIPKRNLKDFSGYIVDEDAFHRFADDFNVVGVKWSEPEHLSADYFLRLIQNGSFERARSKGRGFHRVNDDYANEMYKYYTGLLDHGALWKTYDGGVLCTAMPYGDYDSINEIFIKMRKELNYPFEVRIKVLDDKYRYRPNGDCMIAIYYDKGDEQYDPNCSDEFLRKEVRLHSTSGISRVAISHSFIRNRYISEYAKRRANGSCQLCGKPAPFLDKYGEPYLEAHHVIWLADGGTDSIDNVVALCPNCHRKMHICDDNEDVQKLLRVARE